MSRAAALFSILVLLGATLTLVSPQPENPETSSDARSFHVNLELEEARIEKKSRKGRERVGPTSPDGRRKWFEQRYGKDPAQRSRKLLEAKTELDELRSLQKNHPEVQQRLDANKDGGIFNWEWLGPGNIGGRVRALLTHPTQPLTLLTGGTTGGVWKSTNWGGSWDPKDDFISNLGIACMAMDPTNPNIIYAGTGEVLGGFPGAGIFRSNDGGETWALLPSTSTYTFVHSLAHHPTQAGRLYAGTSSGLFESTDFGASWTQRLAVLSVVDLDIHPLVSSRMVAGSRTDAYFSGDAGLNWTRITDGFQGIPGSSPGRCAIEIADANPNWMYVMINRGDGEVWRSIDFGQSWQLRHNASTLVTYAPGEASVGWWAMALWVHPMDPNFVIAGGLDLWRSVDGGNSFVTISDWTKYHTGQSAHADQHVIVADTGFNGSTNQIVFVGNDGGVQMANNIATVGPTSGWINLANNLGITQFYGGSASNDGSTIAGGTQDNSVLRYRNVDGAQGWFQSFTGDGGFTAVHPTNPNIIYSETQFLNVVKSTNGGDSYGAAINGLTHAGDNTQSPFIAPLVMDPNDAQTLYAGSRAVWRTVDGATSWFPIRPNNAGSAFVSAIDVAPGNSQLIWVGYADGELAKQENQVWSVVEPGDAAGALPNSDVSDIAINPLNHDEVLVTLGRNGTNRVWYTDDGGSTWAPRTGTGIFTIPSNLPVHTVRFHPTNPNWVYVGTELGVFASEDKGVHWSVEPHLGTHEGPRNTATFELFWQGNFLIAATHGRGMYRTLPASTSPPSTIVTNTNDAGFGSLRWAIASANATAGADAISFQIPGTGPHVIQLQSGLPAITDELTISGANQAGWSANINFYMEGFSAVLPIQIHGNGFMDGLRSATNSPVVIDGIELRDFVNAVELFGNDSVRGCRILDSDIGVRLISDSNEVGGMVPEDRNSIENCEVGIRVDGGDNNTLRGNRILDSQNLAIDLLPSGITPNDLFDPDTGSNSLVNFPDLGSAEVVTAGTRVLGSMSGRRNESYTIDFWAQTACDPAGHGGASWYLGTTTVAPGATGVVGFDVTLPRDVSDGTIITATATVAGEGTSEFSSCVVAEEIPWKNVTGSPALNGLDDGRGVSWVDYDDDGDYDIYIVNKDAANELLRNDGNEDFVNVTPAVLAVVGASGSAVWGDFDRDGDPDLYLARFQAANMLFRNDGGGSFTDITTPALAISTGSNHSAWVDVDNDGDLDLYTGNTNSQNYLFVNDGAGNLVENTPTALVDPANTRGFAWADYDGDGDQDIYIAHNQDGTSRLVRNDGNLNFVDVSAAPINDTGQARGVAWGDFDNDGDLDLYVTKFQEDNRLFRNDGSGVFSEIVGGVTAHGGTGRSCSWIDYNNDGLLDIYVVNAQMKNRLYRNDGQESFTDVTDDAIGNNLGATAAAWADFDQDGDLDVFLPNNGANQLVRNDPIQPLGWLHVVAQGTVSNPEGIGARISIGTLAWQQTREISAGSGFLSQHAAKAAFGLGTATSVAMEVRWPSGQIDLYPSVAANQVFTVVETAPTALPDLQLSTRLTGAMPNPFNPRTEIRFDLGRRDQVTLEIFDVRGRRVRSLIQGVSMDAGRHSHPWDGLDGAGQPASSGVYYARLKTREGTQGRAMTLVR